MTTDEAARLLRRIDAIWPPKTPPAKDERLEWLAFLAPLDAAVAAVAVDLLRETATWSPRMADMRSAYNEAAGRPPGAGPALPPGQDAGGEPSLRDIYGEAQDRWVYCWRCDMAITLEERATAPHYDPERGLYHGRCPRNGSAPLIPRGQQIRRDEHFRSRGIAIGRAAEPFAYSGRD